MFKRSLYTIHNKGVSSLKSMYLKGWFSSKNTILISFWIREWSHLDLSSLIIVYWKYKYLKHTHRPLSCPLPYSLRPCHPPGNSQIAVMIFYPLQNKRCNFLHRVTKIWADKEEREHIVQLIQTKWRSYSFSGRRDNTAWKHIITLGKYPNWSFLVYLRLWLMGSPALKGLHIPAYMSQQFAGGSNARWWGQKNLGFINSCCFLHSTNYCHQLPVFMHQWMAAIGLALLN